MSFILESFFLSPLPLGPASFCLRHKLLQFIDYKPLALLLRVGSWFRQDPVIGYNMTTEGVQSPIRLRYMKTSSDTL